MFRFVLALVVLAACAVQASAQRCNVQSQSSSASSAASVQNAAIEAQIRALQGLALSPQRAATATATASSARPQVAFIAPAPQASVQAQAQGGCVGGTCNQSSGVVSALAAPVRIATAPIRNRGGASKSKAVTVVRRNGKTISRSSASG